MKETGVEERCWIEEHQQDESVLQAVKDERKAYEEAVIKSKTQVSRQQPDWEEDVYRQNR